MDRLLGVKQFMLCDVSAGVHLSRAALKFTHVAVGVEGVAHYFKRQLATLEGLLNEYRNRHGHVHAHALEKALAVILELFIYSETNL
jgi:hypothetical protein